MNNMIRCLIVDDEPVAREILETYITKIPNLELVKSCKNAMEALITVQNEKIDLFFLDINMPEITGLSLAKLINKNASIIFTTAYREYALDGFNLQATDYLLKPIAFDRFLQAIQKISTPKSSITIKNKAEEISTFMFVRADRKMVKIIFDEILFIESLGDYLKIHTQKETLITRETVNNIEAKLPTKNFIRIHRSYIINIEKINAYTNEQIEINNKSIPISRSYKESVLQKLAQV